MFVRADKFLVCLIVCAVPLSSITIIVVSRLGLHVFVQHKGDYIERQYIICIYGTWNLKATRHSTLTMCLTVTQDGEPQVDVTVPHWYGP